MGSRGLLWVRVWHAWLSGKLRDLYAGHQGSVPGPAGDFMSRHMPPASPQEVGACCNVCPFVFQWHWGRCTCLENGNVVNVDVNPFPSPHFLFPSIARCWWGCSPLRGHGVQLGIQTEGHEHEHEWLWEVKILWVRIMGVTLVLSWFSSSFNVWNNRGGPRSSCSVPGRHFPFPTSYRHKKHDLLRKDIQKNI
jgi:hypothetical protein